MTALASIAAVPQPEPFSGAGFTVLPRLFAREEIGWLADEARAIGLLHGRHADGTLSPEAPRGTVFGPHRHQRSFLDLALHPRLTARAGFGAAVRLHQTRLWPGGRRPVPAGAWCDGEAWQRLDGLDPAGAITAIVFLEDAGPGAGLFVWAEGTAPRDRAAETAAVPASPMLLSPPAGSVVLIRPTLFHAAADGAAHPAPSLFFAGLVPDEPPRPLGRRRAPFVIELPVASPRADDCLWPTPYFVAG